MAAFPSSRILTTVDAYKEAYMRLPEFSEVKLEVQVTINEGITADSWVPHAVFAMGFLKQGDSYHGPSVTFWNDGRMIGSDSPSDFVTGLPVMTSSTPIVYRIEWGPYGFKVYADDVLYANPPYVDQENYFADGGAPLTTGWAGILGYSPGGGDLAFTADYIDILGTGGSAPEPVEFWTAFVGSREVV